MAVTRSQTRAKNAKKAAPKVSKTLNKKITQIAKRVINNEAETKSGLIPFTPNLTIQNNFFRRICSNFLATSTGTGDSESTQGARIGDKIKLKGVKFTALFESNERFPEAYIRILIIKKYRGAPVTDNATTSACGLFRVVAGTGNAVLDQFDTEKNRVIYQKIIKLKLGNQAICDSVGASSFVGTGDSGLRLAGTNNVLDQPIYVGQAATYRWTVWLSAKKLTGNKSGIITYENSGSSSVKDWDYEVWFGGHSGLVNGTFSGASAFNVAAHNQGWAKMYYKDM